jgi:hypothetical protein
MSCLLLIILREAGKQKKNVLFFSRIQTSVHIIVLEEVEFKLQEFRTLSLVFLLHTTFCKTTFLVLGEINGISALRQRFQTACSYQYPLFGLGFDDLQQPDHG